MPVSLHGYETPRSDGLDFAAANTVVYDPQGSTLPVLKDPLRTLGFRQIMACRQLDQTKDLLATTNFHLVIVDIDQEPAAACDFVRDIRFRRAGKDPFVGILLVSQGIAEGNAGPLVNSGTDDVLIKPMSFESVRARMIRLVKARKLFVATPTYIGPDRRNERRPDEADIDLVGVPNTLREVANGIVSDNWRIAAKRTFRTLAEQRVRRLGFAISKATAETENAGGDPSRAERPGFGGLDEQATRLGADLKAQSYQDLAAIVETARPALKVATGGKLLTSEQLEALSARGDDLLALRPAAAAA